MIKKTTEIKIDSSKASSQGGATTVPATCTHCGHLTVALIENADKPLECVNCNQLFMIKDAKDAKGKREK